MLLKNHVFHKKTKHIDTRYLFMRELVNKKEICLKFSKSREQVTDIFTKYLARDAFSETVQLSRSWRSNKCLTVYVNSKFLM
jgi:hypothetical protein